MPAIRREGRFNKREDETERIFGVGCAGRTLPDVFYEAREIAQIAAIF